MEAIGKFGGIGKGVGLGILAVISLAVAIVFGKYCSYINIREDVKSGEFKNPTKYDQNIYDSALAACIFGSISAAACIVSIVFAIILSGQKMILTIVSAIPLACGIACIICEACYYEYNVKDFIRSQISTYSSNYPANQRIVANPFYRNTSTGQKYIKKTLKAFYEQAIKNVKTYLKDEPATLANFEKYLISWEDVEKAIGEEYKIAGNTYTYFNYPYLWSSTGAAITETVQLDKDDNNKFYITFYVDSSTSTGTIGPKGIPKPKIIQADVDGASIPIGTIGFTASYSGSVGKNKYNCCWNTSRTEFKCKDVENKIEDKDPIYTTEMPWSLNQYIMIKDHYITNTKKDEDETKKYNVKYLIQNFPIAYTLVDYDEYYKNRAAADQKNLFYEKDTDHFKVSGKSAAKYQVNKANQPEIQDDYDDMNEKYWCTEEPKNYDDAFGTSGKCGESIQVTDFINLDSTATDDEPLVQAFDMANIGKYPGFVTKYWRGESNYYIFNYHDESRLCQFAVAAFIITIVGVLFLGAGVGIGFLPGSD